MKKNYFFFIASILGAILGSCTSDEDYNSFVNEDFNNNPIVKIRPNAKTVKNIHPGMLRTFIPKDDWYTIKELKVEGEINATDIIFIRELIGVDCYGWATTKGNLEYLDLSNAKIITDLSVSYLTQTSSWGGNSYTNSYYTSEYVIGEYMFSYCYNLKEIILPYNTTTIGFSAFEHCRGLTHIYIPKNVSRIENNAFYYCESLEAFSIPISFIDFRYIFNSYSYNNIKDVYFFSEKLQFDEYGIPISIDNNIIIHVPKGCKDNYQKYYPHNIIVEE